MNLKFVLDDCYTFENVSLVELITLVTSIIGNHNEQWPGNITCY